MSYVVVRGRGTLVVLDSSTHSGEQLGTGPTIKQRGQSSWSISMGINVSFSNRVN